jgi:hypothetical protein
MPLQNRVTPFSAIVATPHRGTWMGNRGCLHDDRRQLASTAWRHRNWIICTLQYREIRRTLMAPRQYTELFFLDESTALAAGHRPCAFCRRDAYNAYVAAWQSAIGHRPSAKEIDAVLHAQRVPIIRDGKRPPAKAGTLPNGTFVVRSDPHEAWRIHDRRFERWTFEGYCDSQTLDPDEVVEVLTPAATVACLREGYESIESKVKTVDRSTRTTDQT